MTIDVDMNVLRQSRAYRVLRFYKEQILREAGAVGEEDVTDLLADMRHFCARGDIDMDALIAASAVHYEMEKGEPQ